MREITLGNISAFKKINIKVCGAESILVKSPREYSVAFDRVDTYTGASIPWATLTQFFTFNTAGLSSPDCRSVDLSHLQLFTDTTFTTEWSDTSLLELLESPSDVFPINVYNDQNHESTYTLYLRETTLGGKYGYLQLNIEVCGNEEVNLIKEGDFLDYTWGYRSGGGMQSVKNIVSKFQCSSKLCPIYSLKIMNYDGSTYTEYENDDIKFSNSMVLNVQTLYELNQTVYIEASSKFGSVPAYLPVTILIEKVELYQNPMPPFFVEGIDY